MYGGQREDWAEQRARKVKARMLRITSLKPPPGCIRPPLWTQAQPDSLEQWQGIVSAIPGFAGGIAKMFGGGGSDPTKIPRAEAGVAQRTQAFMFHITPLAPLMRDQSALSRIAGAFDSYIRGTSKYLGAGVAGDPESIIQAIRSGGPEFATAALNKLNSVTAEQVGGAGWNGKRLPWTKFKARVAQAITETPQASMFAPAFPTPTIGPQSTYLPTQPTYLPAQPTYLPAQPAQPMQDNSLMWIAGGISLVALVVLTDRK